MRSSDRFSWRALCTGSSQEERELFTVVHWRLQATIILQVRSPRSQWVHAMALKAGIWRGVRGDRDQVSVGRRCLCKRNCLQQKLLLWEQLANRSTGVLSVPVHQDNFLLRMWPNARASLQRFSPDHISSRLMSTSPSRANPRTLC